MKEVMLQRIYSKLKAGKTVNLTKLLREEQKEFEDIKGKEEQVITVTLEVAGSTDPVFYVNKFRKSTLVDSSFYYRDQMPLLKAKLKQLIQV